MGKNMHRDAQGRVVAKGCLGRIGRQHAEHLYVMPMRQLAGQHEQAAARAAVVYGMGTEKQAHGFFNCPVVIIYLKSAQFRHEIALLKEMGGTEPGRA